MASDNRSTSYAFIVYPDSVDVELLFMHLRSLHLPCAVSPLHDSDVYDQIQVNNWQERAKKREIDAYDLEAPEVGKPKKPHYHVIISFGKSKKSAAQVLAMIRPVMPGLNYVEPIRGLGGYVRYLCHLDDDDKARYSVEDVQAFGNFDLSPLWEVSKADRREALAIICGWCRYYHIVNYCDLVDVVVELGRPDMWDVVTDKAFFLGKYLEGLYLVESGALQYSVDVDKVVEDIKRDGTADTRTGELKEVV